MRRAILATILLTGTAQAACPGFSVCPAVNYAGLVAVSPTVKALQAAIDAQEAASQAALTKGGLSAAQSLALLGQALAFEKTLSVHGNQACTFCHSPAAGFAGGIKAFVPAAGVFDGSVTYRAGERTPQSLAYAAFAPPLALLPPPGGFAGGNFWDSRATGAITGIPAADQAAGPLTNPLEMALPDPACAVRRVALSPLASAFTQAWGSAALAISWPADTDTVCARANDGAANQTPLALDSADRAQATTSLYNIGRTIAAYEASTLASPFSSKYDAVQAGTASFTALESEGQALFDGQGHCNHCHADRGPRPVFTTWQSINDGVPHNPKLPYLTENVADSTGYVANPAGTAFVDPGLQGYLVSEADTNTQWRALASQFLGTFQVPTLRNVAAVEAVGAARTYMHNGYFTSLAAIVHFYNTRDVLPTCTGATGIGVTCWPAPEQPENETHVIGNLGLTRAQEAAIVAFLGTLTDGYRK